MRPLLLALLLTLAPAWGQDEEEGGLSLTDFDTDIDLDGDSKTVTFQGDFSQKSETVVKNQTVGISHNGGNITVRCTDTEVITARVVYSVDGEDEASASGFGKGIKMRTTRTSVNVITPYQGSKVKRKDINLTVSVPTNAVVTANTTGGWAQAVGCNGFVTMSAGTGGAFAEGELDGFRITAREGDAKVVVTGGDLTKASTITAPRGKVDLEWPPGQSVRLAAKGESVKISEALEGQVTSTSINGTLGSGGPSLTINAGGPIVIRTR